MHHILLINYRFEPKARSATRIQTFIMFRQRKHVSIDYVMTVVYYLYRVALSPAGYTLGSPFPRRIEQLLVVPECPVSGCNPVRDGVLFYLSEVG